MLGGTLLHTVHTHVVAAGRGAVGSHKGVEILALLVQILQVLVLIVVVDADMIGNEPADDILPSSS